MIGLLLLVARKRCCRLLQAASALRAHTASITGPLCHASHRYYRRLLQMGVRNTELWTNMGLCCFYSSQYDMALGAFDQALQLAEDDTLADVWYNVSQVRCVDVWGCQWMGMTISIPAVVTSATTKAVGGPYYFLALC